MKQLSLFIFVLIFSCSSQTQIVKSWKEPGSKITSDTFKKVLIAALVKNEETRQLVEDRIVKTNPAFYPSHKVFTNLEITGNTEHCKEVLKEQQFDGVVTLQLVKSDVQDKFVPGTWDTGGYWGYHNYSYSTYYQPGYYREDTNFVIETNVFSLADNKLIWAGITNTVNPKTLEHAVDEVMEEVRSQMIKDKILKK